MPPEIATPLLLVQRRVAVATPQLSAQVAEAVSARDRHRLASGELVDAEQAETLAQLPGAGLQSLSRLDRHKANSEKISTLFRDGGRVNIANKVAQCSDVLQLSQASRGQRWKVNTFSCYVRECPMCDARAAAERGRRLSEAVAIVQAAHPKMRWLFLTLSVRNCALGELRSTIIHMNASWQRLIQRKETSRYMIGWSRAVEVTRGEDGSAHPHAHILLGVSSTYFKSGYLSHDAWRDQWRSCARLDYDPIVHITAVRDLGGLMKEVTKAAGYSVKPAQLQFDDKWLSELHDQQSKLRFFSAGGEIKDALKSLSASEIDDEMDTEDGASESSEDLLRSLQFRFRSTEARYRRSR